MANSTLRDVSHIEKFNGHNFPQWKFGVWLILEQYNLVPLVEGREAIPVEVNVPMGCISLLLMYIFIVKVRDDANVITNAVAISDWRRRDIEARNYLYVTIDNAR